MLPHDASPFASGPFSSETRAEVERRFGSGMAEVVLSGVARALRETAADAERAGLDPETAVAGFLHVCREFCKAMEREREHGEGNPGDGLN